MWWPLILLPSCRPWNGYFALDLFLHSLLTFLCLEFDMCIGFHAAFKLKSKRHYTRAEPAVLFLFYFTELFHKAAENAVY